MLDRVCAPRGDKSYVRAGKADPDATLLASIGGWIHYHMSGATIVGYMSGSCWCWCAPNAPVDACGPAWVSISIYLARYIDGMDVDVDVDGMWAGCAQGVWLKASTHDRSHRSMGQVEPPF